MQSNYSRRAQSSSAPNVPFGNQRFVSDMNPRSSLILMAVLCVLVPPIGVLLLWRASRITFPFRLILTGAGFVSMTLIFFLLMRPDAAAPDILPMPSTPEYAGYGYIPSDLPEPTQIPAQPVIAPVIPAENAGQATGEPQELTDETIVYAVTNNASSYHLHQICDFQENNRQMTLLEALYEGLEPCEKCVGAAG